MKLISTLIFLMSASAFSAEAEVLDCQVETDRPQRMQLIVDDGEYRALLSRMRADTMATLDITDQDGTPDFKVELTRSANGMVEARGVFHGVTLEFAYENKALDRPTTIEVTQTYENQDYSFTMRCKVKEY